MPNFFTLTQFDFHQRLTETPGISLVCFTAAGCGSCRQMRQALQGLHASRPALSVFEVDAQHEPGLVREFDVFHLPSLFLYRAGEYHRPLEAEPLPDRLAAALDAALALPALDPP
ncbi:MAG: thioredoxin family protein [Gammaproteobacteria bacterium]|nr:thioredoxin family protein [Gammaproteobacteria bacterium]